MSEMVKNLNFSGKKRKKKVFKRFFLFRAVFIIVLALSYVAIGETRSYSLEMKNGSISPSSELTLNKGESVSMKGDNAPLTVRISNAKGSVELPSRTHPKKEGKDVIFLLKKNDTVTIKFLRSGDFRFWIDGINDGQHAYKCGVDVLPHAVEGMVHVKK